jgi:cytidyltransferase-like protein
MKKVVLVTGCFQLLHRGHLNLLQKAARFGKVIVLLNSDAGVLELKNYLAEPFSTRKEKILDTRLVEKVIEFDTNPANLIRDIKPDIIVAGSDHSKEEIMKKGGKYSKQIIIINYTPGISSTQIWSENESK